MEYVPSTKGYLQLLLDGYIYHKAYTRSNGGTYWRCSDRKCRGRVKTVGERYFMNHAHDHSPDPLKVEECRTRSRLKGLVAANPNVSPSTMARFVLAEKPEEIATLLPKPSSYSQMIRRIKHRLEEDSIKKEYPLQYVLAYFPCDRSFSIRSIAVLRPDVDVTKLWNIEELQAEGPFEICKVFEGNKQLLSVDICAVSTDKTFLRTQMKEFSDNVASVTPIIEPIVDVKNPVDNSLKGCKKVYFLSGNKPRAVQHITSNDGSEVCNISIPSFQPTVNVVPVQSTSKYDELLQKYGDLMVKYDALKKHHSECQVIPFDSNYEHEVVIDYTSDNEEERKLSESLL